MLIFFSKTFLVETLKSVVLLNIFVVTYIHLDQMCSTNCFKDILISHLFLIF